MNNALLAAYKKGLEAGLDRKEKSNPYYDVRNRRGGVTFSRAFFKQWECGFRAGMSIPDKPSILTTMENDNG